MTSMLDGVQEFLTPSFLSRVSNQTGESEAAVSKGFTALVPTLLASIANRSGDAGFMSRLAGLATTTSADPDILARSQKSLVGEGVVADTGSGIGGWLSNLLSGGSLSALTSGTARYAGLRTSSASSLLSLAAPLVLGYIGRLMRTDNLDATRLAQRFQTERGTLTAALPAGFSAFLPGAAATTADVRPVTEDVIRRDIPPVVRHEQKRSAGWLWPVALLALAIAGLLWWNARARNVSQEVATNSVRAVGDAASSVRMLTRSLPNGKQLNIPVGGMEDRLIGYLAAPTGAGAFDFDRIEFETGSSTLTPQSRAQIADVARILNAYPNTRIQISGYTDNTGNESSNVALSQGRAEAVLNALRENGAPAANISAQGFGSQNPIADNSTEAGRARNRRVTLSVTPS
jgi:outer membrane protein OmpA-like peptidoglycan-associated protein